MTLIDKLRHRLWHDDGTMRIWREDYDQIMRALAIAQAVDEWSHGRMGDRELAEELNERADEILAALKENR